MTIISGVDGSDTIQIIGIVLIAAVVLLILIGILVCCCCSGDAKSQETRKRAFDAQKRKYAPAPSSEEFAVLVFSVTRWPQLVEAASMHAGGADMRLKQLIAKAASRHGAYYIFEGANATATNNRKVVVSREPVALMRVANDVYATTMLTDFSNNIAANETLAQVYQSSSSNEGGVSSPWSGLELLSALHFGHGRLHESNETSVAAGDDTNASPPPSSPLLLAEGPVVEDAFTIAESLYFNRGHCAMTAPFIQAMGEAAPVPSDQRYCDLISEEVQLLRSQHITTLDSEGVAQIKKFALPPADTKRVSIYPSGRTSATPYTAIIPMTPTHRADAAPFGKDSITPTQKPSLFQNDKNVKEDDMVQRIQERREQQLRQQQQQQQQLSDNASSHPNEVIDFKQDETSQHKPPQQGKHIVNSHLHNNQMPVAELDDEQTDLMDC
jgi:hypothetical protein